MIKAILFDIDGVLVDSVKGNITIYKSLLKKAGYQEPTDSDIKQILHMPLWFGIKELIKSTDKVEIDRVRDFILEPGAQHTALLEFPHNLEVTLEALHRKYRLGIVTSRNKLGVTEIFSQREIEHLFEVVVTYEDITNPKPHPEPLMLALEKLALTPAESIYVGDMDSDVEAAIAAGMKSIHLSSKHHHGATVGIEHFDEIMDVVNRIAKS